MTGMQRFVTYIYAYEGSQKTGNAGYAKIETRGNSGWMEVHVSINKAIIGDAEARFLYLEDGNIKRLTLGVLRLENGRGMEQFTFGTGMILGTRVSFEKTIGIEIVDNREQRYMSFWKDVPSSLLIEISEWDKEDRVKKSAADNREEDIAKLLKEKIKMKEIENKESKNKENENQEGRNTEIKNRERENQEAGNIEIKNKERENQEVRNKESKNEESKNNKESENKEIESKTIENQENKIKEVEINQIEIKEKNINEAEKAFSQKVITKAEKTEKWKDAEQESLHTLEIPMRNIFPNNTIQDIWNNFRKRKNSVQINKDIWAVQIELSDLRELPKRYWYLGNNSFLLHGFFNYRHLLFGTLRNGEWFIGVPGVYARQERVMASIFGFPGFIYLNEIENTARAAHSQELSCEKQQGIWYHILEY